MTLPQTLCLDLIMNFTTRLKPKLFQTRQFKICVCNPIFQFDYLDSSYFIKAGLKQISMKQTFKPVLRCKFVKSLYLV